MKQFWEVIQDQNAKTYEMIGLSYDVAPIKKLVAEMQAHGMSVHCEAPPATTPLGQLNTFYQDLGLRSEEGLFSRLKGDLEKRKIGRAVM